MSGTLYTYPENFRAFKVLIAAHYSGAQVGVADNFQLGKTNAEPSFLEKFPLGKVPAFVTSDGRPISESNAIAYYVSNDQLRGTCDYSRAQVLQFVNMADNEVLPSVCTWVFPTLGILQYNANNTKEAQEHLKRVLGALNKILETRTFLVGERLTLADITMTCNLLHGYKQVFEPAFRAPFPNVTRWFLTCVNQPEFKAELGDFQLCSKAAQFDAKKYAELFGKEKKEKKAKEPKKAAEATPKKEKKEKKPVVKEEAEEEEEEEEKPRAPAFKDPYLDLPKSSFVLDAFKRSYSNEDTATAAIPFFWDNFDKEGWSLWKCTYKYPEELKLVFMTSNLVSGMFQRLEKLRKYAFASMLILGENNNNQIEGIWVLRGQELAFDLVEDWNIDAPSYDFTKLDPDSEETRKEVDKYFLWEGNFGGRPVADGKIYK